MIGVPFLFLALMVILGGVVAYLGDIIGRTIGKKRLKIWRLRPKHTAALGTFLAGMVGTVLTISALAVFVEPVRVWIFEAEKVRVRLNQAERELSDKTKSLNDMESHVSDLQASLEGTGKELDDTTSELKKQRADLLDAKNQNTRLSADSKKLAARVVTFQIDVKKLQSDISRFQVLRTALEGQVTSLKSEKARLEGDNAAMQRMNLTLTNENGVLERNLSALQSSYGQLDKDYEALDAEFNRSRGEFEKELGKYRADLGRAKSELEATTTKLNTEQEHLKEVQNYLDFVEGKGQASRKKPIIYRLSDELSRVSIRDSLTPAEARQLVLGLLAKARADAKSAGAAENTEGSFAGLLPDGPMSSDEQVAALAQRLSGYSRHRLLVARALGNAFETEFVPLQIDVYENPVVYGNDTVIYETAIDGRKSSTDIAEILITDLAENLTAKLLRDGMIPAVGRPVSLGEVPNSMVISIVEQLRAGGTRMKVQFMAAGDIRAGDRVNFTFRVRQ